MVTTTASHIVRVSACDLRAIDRSWAFADRNAEAIDFHWDMRQVENPNFFDGRIRLLTDYSVETDTLRGVFLETGFKEFLYWREHGEPDAGVIDAFGSALIRSSDGAIVLGRQRPGNINTGVAYLPGGFIDPHDVGVDGCIDIAASTAREVLEETGLEPQSLTQEPGFLLTFHGNQLSIAVQYASPLPATHLREKIVAHLNSDPNSELADVVMVRGKSCIQGLALAPYARVLLEQILS